MSASSSLVQSPQRENSTGEPQQQQQQPKPQLLRHATHSSSALSLNSGDGGGELPEVAALGGAAGALLSGENSDASLLRSSSAVSGDGQSHNNINSHSHTSPPRRLSESNTPSVARTVNPQQRQQQQKRASSNTVKSQQGEEDDDGHKDAVVVSSSSRSQRRDHVPDDEDDAEAGKKKKPAEKPSVARADAHGNITCPLCGFVEQSIVVFKNHSLECRIAQGVDPLMPLVVLRRVPHSIFDLASASRNLGMRSVSAVQSVTIFPGRQAPKPPVKPRENLYVGGAGSGDATVNSIRNHPAARNLEKWEAEKRQQRKEEAKALRRQKQQQELNDKSKEQASSSTVQHQQKSVVAPLALLPPPKTSPSSTATTTAAAATTTDTAAAASSPNNNNHNAVVSASDNNNHRRPPRVPVSQQETVASLARNTSNSDANKKMSQQQQQQRPLPQHRLVNRISEIPLVTIDKMADEKRRKWEKAEAEERERQRKQQQQQSQQQRLSSRGSEMSASALAAIALPPSAGALSPNRRSSSSADSNNNNNNNAKKSPDRLDSPPRPEQDQKKQSEEPQQQSHHPENSRSEDGTALVVYESNNNNNNDGAVVVRRLSSPTTQSGAAAAAALSSGRLSITSSTALVVVPTNNNNNNQQQLQLIEKQKQQQQQQQQQQQLQQLHDKNIVIAMDLSNVEITRPIAEQLIAVFAQPVSLLDLVSGRPPIEELNLSNARCRTLDVEEIFAIAIKRSRTLHKIHTKNCAFARRIRTREIADVLKKNAERMHTLHEEADFYYRVQGLRTGERETAHNIIHLLEEEHALRQEMVHTEWQTFREARRSLEFSAQHTHEAESDRALREQQKGERGALEGEEAKWRGKIAGHALGPSFAEILVRAETIMRAAMTQLRFEKMRDTRAEERVAIFTAKRRQKERIMAEFRARARCEVDELRGRRELLLSFDMGVEVMHELESRSKRYAEWRRRQSDVRAQMCRLEGVAREVVDREEQTTIAALESQFMGDIRSITVRDQTQRERLCEAEARVRAYYCGKFVKLLALRFRECDLKMQAMLFAEKALGIEMQRLLSMEVLPTVSVAAHYSARDPPPVVMVSPHGVQQPPPVPLAPAFNIDLDMPSDWIPKTADVEKRAAKLAVEERNIISALLLFLQREYARVLSLEFEIFTLPFVDISVDTMQPPQVVIETIASFNRNAEQDGNIDEMCEQVLRRRCVWCDGASPIQILKSRLAVRGFCAQIKVDALASDKLLPEEEAAASVSSDVSFNNIINNNNNNNSSISSFSISERLDQVSSLEYFSITIPIELLAHKPVIVADGVRVDLAARLKAQRKQQLSGAEPGKSDDEGTSDSDDDTTASDYVPSATNASIVPLVVDGIDYATDADSNNNTRSGVTGGGGDGSSITFSKTADFFSNDAMAAEAQSQQQQQQQPPQPLLISFSQSLSLSFGADPEVMDHHELNRLDPTELPPLPPAVIRALMQSLSYAVNAIDTYTTAQLEKRRMERGEEQARMKKRNLQRKSSKKLDDSMNNNNNNGLLQKNASLSGTPVTVSFLDIEHDDSPSMPALDGTDAKNNINNASGTTPAGDDDDELSTAENSMTEFTFNMRMKKQEEKQQLREAAAAKKRKLLQQLLQLPVVRKVLCSASFVFENLITYTAQQIAQQQEMLNALAGGGAGGGGGGGAGGKNPLFAARRQSFVGRKKASFVGDGTLLSGGSGGGSGNGLDQRRFSTNFGSSQALGSPGDGDLDDNNNNNNNNYNNRSDPFANLRYRYEPTVPQQKTPKLYPVRGLSTLFVGIAPPIATVAPPVSTAASFSSSSRAQKARTLAQQQQTAGQLLRRRFIERQKEPLRLLPATLISNVRTPYRMVPAAVDDPERGQWPWLPRPLHSFNDCALTWTVSGASSGDRLVVLEDLDVRAIAAEREAFSLGVLLHNQKQVAEVTSGFVQTHLKASSVLLPPEEYHDCARAEIVFGPGSGAMGVGDIINASLFSGVFNPASLLNNNNNNAATARDSTNLLDTCNDLNQSMELVAVPSDARSSNSKPTTADTPSGKSAAAAAATAATSGKHGVQQLLPQPHREDAPSADIVRALLHTLSLSVLPRLGSEIMEGVRTVTFDFRAHKSDKHPCARVQMQIPVEQYREPTDVKIAHPIVLAHQPVSGVVPEKLQAHFPPLYIAPFQDVLVVNIESETIDTGRIRISLSGGDSSAGDGLAFCPDARLFSAVDAVTGGRLGSAASGFNLHKEHENAAAAASANSPFASPNNNNSSSSTSAPTFFRHNKNAVPLFTLLPPNSVQFVPILYNAPAALTDAQKMQHAMMSSTTMLFSAPSRQPPGSNNNAAPAAALQDDNNNNNNNAINSVNSGSSSSGCGPQPVAYVTRGKILHEWGDEGVGDPDEYRDLHLQLTEDCPVAALQDILRHVVVFTQGASWNPKYFSWVKRKVVMDGTVGRDEREVPLRREVEIRPTGPLLQVVDAATQAGGAATAAVANPNPKSDSTILCKEGSPPVALVGVEAATGRDMGAVNEFNGGFLIAYVSEGWEAMDTITVAIEADETEKLDYSATAVVVDGINSNIIQSTTTTTTTTTEDGDGSPTLQQQQQQQQQQQRTPQNYPVGPPAAAASSTRGYAARKKDDGPSTAPYVGPSPFTLRAVPKTSSDGHRIVSPNSSARRLESGGSNSNNNNNNNNKIGSAGSSKRHSATTFVSAATGGGVAPAASSSARRPSRPTLGSGGGGSSSARRPSFSGATLAAGGGANAVPGSASGFRGAAALSSRGRLSRTNSMIVRAQNEEQVRHQRNVLMSRLRAATRAVAATLDINSLSHLNSSSSSNTIAHQHVKEILYKGEVIGRLTTCLKGIYIQFYMRQDASPFAPPGQQQQTTVPTVSRTMVNQLLRALQFQHCSKDPQHVQKFVTVCLAESVAATFSRAVVAVEVEAVDDVTQIAVRQSKLRYMQNPEPFSLLPYGESTLIDPDTDQFNGGFIKVTTTAGASRGDELAFRLVTQRYLGPNARAELKSPFHDLKYNEQTRTVVDKKGMVLALVETRYATAAAVAAATTTSTSSLSASAKRETSAEKVDQAQLEAIAAAAETMVEITIHFPRIVLEELADDKLAGESALDFFAKQYIKRVGVVTLGIASFLLNCITFQNHNTGSDNKPRESKRSFLVRVKDPKNPIEGRLKLHLAVCPPCLAWTGNIYTSSTQWSFDATVPSAVPEQFVSEAGVQVCKNIVSFWEHMTFDGPMSVKFTAQTDKGRRVQLYFIINEKLLPVPLKLTQQGTAISLSTSSSAAASNNTNNNNMISSLNPASINNALCKIVRDFGDATIGFVWGPGVQGVKEKALTRAYLQAILRSLCLRATNEKGQAVALPSGATIKIQANVYEGSDVKSSMKISADILAQQL